MSTPAPPTPRLPPAASHMTLLTIGVLALSPVPPLALSQVTPGLPDILASPTTWQWAVRESVSWVLILVLLFFYRRDWLNAVDYWKDQNKITAGLVTDTAKSLAEVTAVVRENTTVTHSLKRTLEVNLPLLRRHDGEGVEDDGHTLVDDRTTPLRRRPR